MTCILYSFLFYILQTGFNLAYPFNRYAPQKLCDSLVKINCGPGGSRNPADHAKSPYMLSSLKNPELLDLFLPVLCREKE